MVYIYISITISFVALIFAGVIAYGIRKRKVEDEKAKEISKAIHKGAMAFLNKEYKVLFIFIVVAGAILYFLLGHNTAWAFLCGAIFSALAGNIGMRVATLSNVRTAEAAKKNLKDGLRVAFSSGSVMGMIVVGLGLLGISILYLMFENPLRILVAAPV